MVHTWASGGPRRGRAGAWRVRLLLVYTACRGGRLPGGPAAGFEAHVTVLFTGPTCEARRPVLCTRPGWDTLVQAGHLRGLTDQTAAPLYLTAAPLRRDLWSTYIPSRHGEERPGTLLTRDPARNNWDPARPSTAMFTRVGSGRDVTCWHWILIKLPCPNCLPPPGSLPGAGQSQRPLSSPAVAVSPRPHFGWVRSRPVPGKERASPSLGFQVRNITEVTQSLCREAWRSNEDWGGAGTVAQEGPRRAGRHQPPLLSLLCEAGSGFVLRFVCWVCSRPFQRSAPHVSRCRAPRPVSGIQGPHSWACSPAFAHAPSWQSARSVGVAQI